MRRFQNIDLATLRRLFRQAAFVGLPSVSLALAACGPCPPDDHIFLLRDPGASTRVLIDKCVEGTQSDCIALCDLVVQEDLGFSRGGYFDHCEVHPSKDGYFQVHVGWQDACPGGRRPAGFRWAQAPLSDRYEGARAAGIWLSRLAQLEAASVPAFARLRRELQVHGAPRSFARRAGIAAREEANHARIVSVLARRHGAGAPSPIVPAAIERTLADMLGENAVEGCVRETYGAALAHHQAAAAADLPLRGAMAIIAEEETGHAALAWDIHQWGLTSLDTAGRRRVEESARRAAEALRDEVATEVSRGMRETLGLPTAERAVAIADHLSETLWA